MKRFALHKLLIVLVIAIGAMLLVDLWFNIIPTEFKFKAIVSTIIIIAVVWFVYAIIDDFKEEKDQKKDKYLD